MHTMQEHGDEPHEAQSNGYMSDSPYASDRTRQKNDSQPQMRDTLLTCVGMLVPLLAQAGHGH